MEGGGREGRRKKTWKLISITALNPPFFFFFSTRKYEASLLSWMADGAAAAPMISWTEAADNSVFSAHCTLLQDWLELFGWRMRHGSDRSSKMTVCMIVCL